VDGVIDFNPVAIWILEKDLTDAIRSDLGDVTSSGKSPVYDSMIAQKLQIRIKLGYGEREVNILIGFNGPVGNAHVQLPLSSQGKKTDRICRPPWSFQRLQLQNSGIKRRPNFQIGHQDTRMIEPEVEFILRRDRITRYETENQNGWPNH
jgi:hypothetical protein